MPVFYDQIDLSSVVGAPMADMRSVFKPRRLLEHFTDDECLEEVPELLQ